MSSGGLKEKIRGGGSRNSVLYMLHKVLVIGPSGHGAPTIGYMSVKIQI